MSSNYSISDLSLENKDPIQRLGKNALLQFVTFDYIILKVYEAVAEKSNLTYPKSHHKFNNPYQLDGFELQYMACRCLPCEADKLGVFNEDPLTPKLTQKIKALEKGKHPPYNIEELLRLSQPQMSYCSLYRIYIIALTLQRLWSYVLVNTRRIYDFKVDQQIAELQRSSNSYGTEDKPNDDASSYFIASLKSKILQALRESNLGMPVREEVVDILVEVTLQMGYLLVDDKERMAIDAEGNVKEEENEIRLLSELFPENHTGLGSNPNAPVLSQLLEHSGLAPVFDTVDRFLPNSILWNSCSEVLNNLVMMWGTLFTEMQPEILDILASLIQGTTIVDRFRTSSTITDEQQLFRDGALKFMEDFLERTLLPIRISDLQDALDNTSANSVLYYFRNLRILVDENGINLNNKTTDGTNMLLTPWNCSHNNDESEDVEFRSGRLNFVRLMLWVLSDQKELEEIFAYGRSMWDVQEENKQYYRIDRHKMKNIVPSAIFPGTLETSDVLPNGGMLIDMNYQRQQQNKLILQTRLGRTGGVEAALKDLKVRWMP